MANRLVLELVADSNPMIRALNDVQKRMDSFTQSSSIAGRSLGGGVNQALEAFAGLAKGGAAAAGVLAGAVAAAATAAVALTLNAGKQAEAIDHLSQKTGIAVQSIQRMSVVMAENNFDAQTLTSGMRTLSKMVIDARNPASDAAGAFDEMGISINQLGSTEDVIRAIADKFASMPDGVDKSRLSIMLFGKAGLEMIPVLNRGSAAFDESAKASERFGFAVSTQRTALQAADDAADRLGLAMQALQQQLGATFAPAVTFTINAVTESIASMARMVRDSTSAIGEMMDAFKRNHPTISSMLLGEVSGHAAPKPIFPISTGPQQDAQVGEFAAASAANQVAIGERLRRQHITAFQAQQSAGRAQESLGHVLVQIEQRKQDSINAQLETLFDQESSYRMLTAEEEKGWTIARQSLETWRHRNDELEMAVERSKTVDAAQQAIFRSEGAMLGNSTAARQARLQLIEAEGALQRQTIDETIFNETQKNAAIENLDIQLATRRRQAIQEFPTVWQQQLQTLVASNTFSVGMIVSGWTSGLANAIVNFENFGQTMTQIGKQTAATLLQGILQFGVQSAAEWALQNSKTIALKLAEAAALVGINTGKNAAMLAGDGAAAGGHVTIWAAANKAIVASFGVTAGAVQTFFVKTVIPFFVAIGKALMTFLSSIAGAAKATIFGIPYAVAILAGVAVIGAAIGSILAFAFKDGGIATGPTMGMVGEAGSSEAIIPLNKRGAAFMRETLGLGGGRDARYEQTIVLDGRVLAKSVADHLPSSLRLIGAMS